MWKKYEKATTALEKDGFILQKSWTTMDVRQKTIDRCYQTKKNKPFWNNCKALGAKSIIKDMIKEIILNTRLHSIFFPKNSLSIYHFVAYLLLSKDK